MAESTTTPLSSSRFFCHQCDANVTPLPVSPWRRLLQCLADAALSARTSSVPDACPASLRNWNHRPSLLPPLSRESGSLAVFASSNLACLRLAGGGAGGAGGGAQSVGVNLATLLESLYGRLDPTRMQEAAAGTPAPARDWAASAAPMFRLNLPTAGAAGTGAAFDTSHALEGIIHQILSNVASGALHPGRDPRSQSSARVAGQVDFPLPLFQVLHGNPGDYVWGAGGLDTVITQLLNNLEGSGPPPLSQRDISLIPSVQVSADDVAKSMQCSVCMEDFRVSEPVRRLPCAHLYHTDCIVPWLQMHGTCPICRKAISVADAAASTPAAPPPGPPSGSSRHGSGHYFDLNDYD